MQYEVGLVEDFAHRGRLCIPLGVDCCYVAHWYRRVNLEVIAARGSRIL